MATAIATAPGTATTRILTGLEQMEKFWAAGRARKGADHLLDSLGARGTAADRATRSWASCLAVPTDCWNSASRATTGRGATGRGATRRTRNLHGRFRPQHFLDSSRHHAQVERMTIISQTPQRFFWHPLLACRFIHAAHAVDAARSSSRLIFFFAEHGRRIHKLHMARSTLVQLDSIDCVSPLLCLSMLGCPLPTMISETCWPMEKTKMRTVSPTRRGSSTTYFTIAKPLSGQWMTRSVRLQKKTTLRWPSLLTESSLSGQAHDRPRQLPGPCPVARPLPPATVTQPLETETKNVRQKVVASDCAEAHEDGSYRNVILLELPCASFKAVSLTGSSALLLVWKSDEVKYKGGSFSARLVVGN